MVKVGNKIEVKLGIVLVLSLELEFALELRFRLTLKLTSGLGLCSQLTLGLGLLRSGLELLLPKTKLKSYLKYYDFFWRPLFFSSVAWLSNVTFVVDILWQCWNVGHTLILREHVGVLRTPVPYGVTVKSKDQQNIFTPQDLWSKSRYSP